MTPKELAQLLDNRCSPDTAIAKLNLSDTAMKRVLYYRAQINNGWPCNMPAKELFNCAEMKTAIDALEALERKIDGTYDPDAFPDIGAAHSIIMGLMYALLNLYSGECEHAATDLRGTANYLRSKLV